ncbi:MAG: peroxiredoxin [Aquiluna sp.]|nr:peroxiredoxin [Aquiluna sp.]
MTESAVRLLAGNPAPSFTLLDQDGTAVESSELFQTPTIFFFFPAAGSPGCTKEAEDFQENLSEFAAKGYKIVGVSPDGPERLKEFSLSHDLDFSLLSDPDVSVHKTYGAHGEKSLYGRLYRGVLRSTIIVGADGIVEQAMYNVKATGHTNMLKKKLGF